MKTTVLMTVNLDSWGNNGLSYLEQAINSICLQTEKDFRFFIVFDGVLQKDYIDILKKIDFFKKMVKYDIDWETSGKSIKLGLTTTLNHSLYYILKCKNVPKFILRQDADDYSAPDRLEKLLKIMESDDKIGAVGCNYGVVDSEGKLLHINTANPEKLPVERLAGSIAGGGCLLRTDVVRQIGGWRYPYAQDFYMWVKMRQLGYRIVSSKETLYYYRQHPGQISVAKRESQKAAHREIIDKEIIREGSQKDTKSV